MWFFYDCLDYISLIYNQKRSHIFWTKFEILAIVGDDNNYLTGNPSSQCGYFKAIFQQRSWQRNFRSTQSYFSYEVAYDTTYQLK